MIWARMLAYITGTVDQELLLRNEYLAAENRILRAQIKSGALTGATLVLHFRALWMLGVALLLVTLILYNSTVS